MPALRCLAIIFLLNSAGLKSSGASTQALSPTVPSLHTQIMPIDTQAPSIKAPTLTDIIDTHWRHATKKAVWRAPGIQEREQFSVAIADLLSSISAPRSDETTCQGQSAEEFGRLWSAEFRSTPFQVSVISDKVIAVHERVTERHGGGIYIIRCGTTVEPLVLQAPHAFHDLHTRRLSSALFSATKSRALFLNTMHRFAEGKPESLTDAAHQYGTFFQAATLSIARVNRKFRVVQIHGFAPRESLHFDVILSSGDPTRPPRHLASTLGPRFARVGVFGDNADVLGATSNVQGIALNRQGTGRFIHIELNLDLRTRLLQPKNEEFNMLADALMEPWW